MRISEILDMVLPFIYVLVFIAIIWFIIELILLVRRTRGAVSDVQKKIEPTLDHIEKITGDLKPVAPKIDPLVDRVSLTIDVANLEIMRLDQILEDVTEITDTVSSAASTVDAVANAPVDLVNNITSKVRKAFKPLRASSESISLGEKMSESAHDVVTGIKEAVSDQEAAHQRHKAEHEKAVQEKQETEQAINDAAHKVGSSVLSTIDESSFPENERITETDAKKETVGASEKNK